MSFFVSGTDLLLLTVSIIVYAAGATAWTYYAMAPRDWHPPVTLPVSTGVFTPNAEEDRKE
ncbi:MAG: hypothetical protein NVSMB6_19170 [Burkholderiaceae bacterium]